MSMLSARSSRLLNTASAAADLASRVLPFVLSLIAGSTDIIGFLGLNGLFTAHITGNLVVLAAHIVAGDPTIFSYVLSVPVFMMVLFLTRLLAGGLEQAGVSTLRPLLLLQLFFLAAFLSLCVVAGPWPDANTAVMTTNVTHFMLDLGAALVGRDHAKVPRARARAMRTLPVIVGFTIGCVCGAAFEAAAGLWSLALPTGLALLAFAMGFRRPESSIVKLGSPARSAVHHSLPSLTALYSQWRGGSNNLL
jgi:uncharacterized membrane protein YoaK (UPF0700 family)